MSEKASRATQAASAAGAVLALGIVFFGILRLVEGDTIAALAFVVAGLFLRDAAIDIHARLRFGEGVRGLAVRDAMLTEVATVPAHVALSELVPERFLRGGYQSYPAIRGEQVVGLLSLPVVLAISPEERQRTTVQAVMTPLGANLVAGAGEPLVDAMARMARTGAKRLLVVEDGRLSGLLSLSSVLRHMRMRVALSS